MQVRWLLTATIWLVGLLPTPQVAWCDEPRLTIPLEAGWRFVQDDHLAGAENPSFGDDTWTTVSVPHTWNRAGAYAAEGAQRAAVLNTTRGVGWYRLRFNVPAAFAGRRVWVQFDAASLRAEVWLNGIRLGEHLGGFSRFRFDATDALSLTGPNTLVVRTDNSVAAPGSATADILPIAGDFFIYGGLYRPVSIVATAALHIDMLDYGGPGIYIRTQRLHDRGADLEIQSKIRNDQPQGARALLAITVRNRSGHVVTSQEHPISLEPGGRLDVLRKIHVAHAHLWQGIADPYLYRVAVELHSPAGELLDRVEQEFGIRQLRIDPRQGLFLNGHPLRLHGVALHQDREAEGWAVSAANEREDLALIREMGANSIRFTHYQHSDSLNRLADEYGLLNWAEIPLVTRWTLAGADSPTPGLVNNASQQLIELIRQGFNHASIAVWSLANEVDFGSALPVIYAGRELPAGSPLPLLKTLRGIARTEDPTRLSTIASCCYGRPNTPKVIDAADLSGANRYYGWYYTVPADLAADLDSIRAAYPAIPLAVSEYGAGGAVTQSTDNPLGGPVDPRGHLQPEDYQSLVHEQTWPLLERKPYLWGSWIFAMFDFSTPLRNEGDSVSINTKGLVTFDRRTRKDAFYFYKANWSSTPTVYIANRRHRERDYPVTDLKIYSNAAATEARLNGLSLGTLQRCRENVCRWPGIRLRAGDNTLEAIGTWPSGTQRDTVSWHLGTPIGIYRIDCGALEGAAGPEGRYGSDDFFEGGSAAAINALPPVSSGSSAPTRTIDGSTFTALLNTYRKGEFTYRLPLPDGAYNVRLWFVEPDAAPTERLVSVLANGAPRIVNLDVAAAAGGPRAALQQSFAVQVSQGSLVLEFRGSKGVAIVSAIEVEPVGVTLKRQADAAAAPGTAQR